MRVFSKRRPTDNNGFAGPGRPARRWLTGLTVLAVVLVMAGGGAASAIPTAALQGTPVPWVTSPGLNTEEQGLYHLPRDHAYHSGPTYYHNDLREWHYFTLQGTEKATGHHITLFITYLWQGWQESVKRPNVSLLVAYHDADTGAFFPNTLILGGPFVSKGTSDGANFNFDYRITDPDGKGVVTTYDYAGERWHFEGFAPEGSQIANGGPFRYSLDAVVNSPGYLPMAYWGLENIGFNNKYDQNPSTMYGLSYYYTAPQMAMSGTMTTSDGVSHELEGVAWFEHQWGNFYSPEQSRYTWGYARFDNGDAFTWRQYYDNPAGQMYPEQPYNLEAAKQAWQTPQYQQSRYAWLPAGGRPQYSFGPTVTYTPLEWWTSPTTGNVYPWYSELKTPKGTFYMTPTYPEQETIGAAGPFIEGAMYLHSGSLDGPIVANGFVEMFQIPALNAAVQTLPPSDQPGNIRFDGGLKQP
jgi:hypothetical protein